MSKKLNRREFLKLTGAAAAASAAALAGGVQLVGATSKPSSVYSVPNLQTANKTVRIGILAVNAPILNNLLASSSDALKKLGVDVEIVIREDNKDSELTRITGAVQAGTTPYDIIDFEDELTTSLSRAGYMLGVDDILPKDLWTDFSDAMVAYSKVWSTYNGETFRVIHNWEMPYWWYRKDWFDAKGVAVPKTWDDVKGMGKVFTDTSKGVWATEDGLIKGAFLNVYLAWVTLQAGGNAFDVGDPYKAALQYTYDLMYSYNTLNPASLQTDYNTQNGDYFADKVAFMRQWPFVGDVGRSQTKWYSPDKLAIGLPPVGPGGKAGSTYPAAWGWGIFKQSPNLDAAKEVFTWLVSSDTAVAAMKAGYWFLNARKSVLAVADPAVNWEVVPMKMYTDAGIIGVRPFHPRFVEALTILEDTASAYLSKQGTIDDAINQAKTQLAALATPATPAAS